MKQGKKQDLESALTNLKRRYKKISTSSLLIILDPVFNCLTRPFIKLGKFFVSDSKSLKRITPCLRRQKLYEEVEDRITSELDIVNLLSKLRRYDSML